MSTPRICIAGIEPGTGRHIRPVTGRKNPLERGLLRSEGGPCEIGAKIDLGRLKARPSPPETEDHLFWPERARHLGRLDPDDYLGQLQMIASQDLEQLFGVDLKRREWNFAVPTGQGKTSLACFRPRNQPKLTSDFGKLSVQLAEWEKPAYRPMTDLRLVGSDHKTVRRDVVEDVNRRLRRGAGVVLMLGLARAWKAPTDDEERHWLQVNGICLEDSPLGDDP